MTMMIPINASAEMFATHSHDIVNQQYGNGLPYSFHLEMVVNFAQKYKHLIPVEDFNKVKSACWLHDTIEDCRINYNEIKKRFGLEIAEVVYAVTNNKGRSREQRADSAYYQGIREVKYATFVKVCDRLANSLFSLMNGSSMFDKYVKEYAHFKYELYVEEYAEMFADLETLYQTRTVTF